MITKLEPNQIFVCGTNVMGIHGAGAAAQAFRDFGALLGQATGCIGGQSYGIATLNNEMNQVTPEYLREQAKDLRTVARANPNKEFLLTPIGTGIAGFDIEFVEEVFNNMPDNVIKIGWKG